MSVPNNSVQMIILAIVCKLAYCQWCPMLFHLKENNPEVVITS